MIYYYFNYFYYYYFSLFILYHLKIRIKKFNYKLEKKKLINKTEWTN